MCFQRKRLWLSVIVHLLTIILIITPWAYAIDIGTVPTETEISPAPAMIMFILDDSGSMDWEFMTSENEGTFDGEDYLSASAVKPKVKAQWSGYNKIYYNPVNKYEPWPGTASHAMGNASLTQPKRHPTKSNTVTLNNTYYNLEDLSGPHDIVDNRDSGDVSHHPSVWSESGAWPEYNGSSYYSGADGAWFRWDLQVPEAGNYNVYLFWTSGNGWNRDENALYTIHHNNKDHNLNVNQEDKFGQWNLVPGGPFYFDAVGAEYIRLDRDGSNSSADAVKIIKEGNTVDIRYSHYYVWDDDDNDGTVDSTEMWLVNIVFDDGNNDGNVDAGEVNREFYQLNKADFDDNIQFGELTKKTSLPASITPKIKIVDGEETVCFDCDVSDADCREMTAKEELQNFANWYQYYRQRYLASNAAVALSINDMTGVKIGLYTLHERVTEGVRDIDTQKDAILNDLYSTTASGGTPLRLALKHVGEYYRGNYSTIGPNPYASEDDGGGCQQAFTVAMTDGYWNGGSPSVGDQDGNLDPPYGPTLDGNGNPTYDSDDNTLADVAMYYYTTDLQTGLSNVVKTSACDDNTKQHMVTYTVSFGVSGNVNVADYDADGNGKIDAQCNLDPPPKWQNGSSVNTNEEKIDDLWHAAVNGRGMYFNASNPQALVDTLKSAMNDVTDRLVSGSAVALSGEELYDGSDMYQALYRSSNWTGDLVKKELVENNGTVDFIEKWNASDLLDTREPDSRNIITSNETGTGVPFRWNNITADMQSRIKDISTDNGENILRFIRGEDIGGFRGREHLLGDIVNSSPVVYNDTVYVGSNDGMLHAFNTANGSERFGYVPGMLLDKLKTLKAMPYDMSSHEYFVDMTPDYMAVDSDTTILYGGLGYGGKGYYALNINDIETVTTEAGLASKVLWEYTDSSDLGYAFSKMLMLQTGDTSRPWIAVFGNGYNSASSEAKLILINAITGDHIQTISTGVASDNGLSTPAIVYQDGNDTDTKKYFAYAGDLKGNMWRFDLDFSSSASIGSAGSPQKIFAAGATKPITTAPDVIYHCSCTDGTDKDAFLVLFSTGKFLHKSDFYKKEGQSVYGIRDEGDATTTDVTDLVEQTVIADGESRLITNNDVEYENGKRGWMLTLPAGDGERGITGVKVADNIAEVITFIPSESPCDGGGDSVVMMLNACTGGRTDGPVIDENDDGDVNDDDIRFIIIDGTVVPVTDLDQMVTYSDFLNDFGSVIADAVFGGNTELSWSDIGSSGQVETAGATGKKFSGKLNSSATVNLENKDSSVKIYSSSGENSDNALEKMTTIKDSRGMFYWKIKK